MESCNAMMIHNELQLHFELLAKEGRAYGLELNMAKTVLLQIGSDVRLHGIDGTPVHQDCYARMGVQEQSWCAGSAKRGVCSAN